MGALEAGGGAGIFFIIAVIIGMIAYPKLTVTILGGYLGMMISIGFGGYIGLQLSLQVFGKGSPLNLIGALLGVAVAWKLFFVIIDKVSGDPEDET